MAAWDDTVRVAVGGYLLDLPAVVVPGQEQAIDSGSRTFEAEGLMVLVDSGPFASRLESDIGRPDYSEQGADVGGVAGRRVSFSDPEAGTHTVGIHLPAPAYLTVVVRAEATVPQGVPEQIVNSLQRNMST